MNSGQLSPEEQAAHTRAMNKLAEDNYILLESSGRSMEGDTDAWGVPLEGSGGLMLGLSANPNVLNPR